MSSAPPPPSSPTPPTQVRNPLHGITLEHLLTDLVAHFGWEELARQVPLRCFAVEPSIGSSLKLLRKTPWAREQVESLYLFMRREQARQQREQARGAKGDADRVS